MNGELDEAKAETRTRLKARLEGLSSEARAVASAAIRDSIRHWARWKEAGTVMLYSALPDEPDLDPLIREAQESGKRVCLPRFGAALAVYEAAELRADMGGGRRGRFGIWEPAEEAPSVPWIQLDLILAPGVGFAPDGIRLGRGRGFFDRLLVHVRGLTCGVAFDEQVVESLPAGPLDIRLDCILTPTRRWVAGRRVVVE